MGGMTVIDLTLPRYVPVMEAGYIGRALCAGKLHDFSRWQMQEAIMTEGRKQTTVLLQSRECIRPRCGYTQVKKI